MIRRDWPRGLSHLGIRARLILLGTVGLAVGLGVGGLVFIVTLRYAVEQTVTNNARATGEEIARLVESGDLPQPLPVAGYQYVQVVDDAHRVVAASANADRLVPVLREDELALAVAGKVLVVAGNRVGGVGSLRVVAVEATNAPSPRTVLVAMPLSDATTGTSLMTKALILIYPLTVLILSIVGWKVAGAALRPVERLRRGAERITGAGVATEELLPVPPSNDEIHRLAVTLNDMLGRLAASRERQRAFVADAAHELRSPLASMRLQLEVAARLEDHGDLTDDLLLDVDRLSRLVNDLLLLARGDEVLPAHRVQPVDLAELLEEIGERYESARVPVEVDQGGVSGRTPWTRGDRGELSRVVINLVDNAVRHARRRVVLKVTTTPAYQVVTVVDDGCGIAEGDRERVFDRFTRLDDGRARDDGGSGLGLAIVREIVRRHGGLVTLADAITGLPGSGLRVEVLLPVDD